MLLHQPPLHSPHQQHHTSTHAVHHTHHMKGVSSFFSKKYDGSVGSGILSPALSLSGAGGSTTVTPITPMTPLTTPRTPLQILLGRQNVGSLRGGPYRRTSITPQSTTNHHTRDSSASLSDTFHEEEDEDHYREKQLLALQLFANFLNTAETTLNDITERENSGHQVLGPGIVRVCNDLADEIENVAVALDKQHYQATKHLQQVMSDHELTLIEEGDTINNNGDEEKVSPESMDTNNLDDPTNQKALALSATLAKSESIASFQSSHEEYITTLSNTHTLLLDLAAALRAVTQQEAQELGEVALEVARMFVWSLGMVHSNMIQMTVQSEQHQQQVHPILPVETNDEGGHDDATADTSKQKSADGVTTKHRVTWFNENTQDNQRGLGPVVEILGEEEKQNQPDTPPKAKPDQLRYTPQLSPIAPSPSTTSSPEKNNNSISVRHLGGERVRVLWPKLLPAVVDASKHCANNAKEHPIPAIALGLTCGPAAIATAAIAGPPLLIADWAIQSSYDALSEHTPVIDNVEKGAANALQVARLAILCSKLVVKQGVQVGERQIERRGGVGKICSDVVDGAVDMALHPVETIGMAWEGMFWMGGALGNAVNFVKDTVAGGDLQADIH